MTDLDTIVRAAIQRLEGLDDALVELERTDSGTVGGVIVSDGFEGLTHVERQDLLWDHFDASLPPDVRANIVMLLAMTPRELRDADSIGAAE